MPIVKPNPSVRTEVFSLGDIAVEAKAILAHAQRRAEQVVAQAAAEGDALRAAARQDGYQAGLAAGQEEGHKAGREQAVTKFDQQFARVARTLAEAVEQLDARKGRMLAEARHDLVALALAAAEKIVRRAMRADPSACVKTVETAVELAGRASRLSVRVHPADLELVQSFAAATAARLTGGAEVQVIADPAIESGGCRVTAWRESGQASEIDATIQTQLDRLAGELLGKAD
jgi:flagellar assembly protein FliH